jgi:hypothetical protein
MFIEQSQVTIVHASICLSVNLNIFHFPAPISQFYLTFAQIINRMGLKFVQIKGMTFPKGRQ